MNKYSYLGFGLGLRPKHYQYIIANQPKEIDWFEIISENYFVPGGNPHHFLDQIRQYYPIVMHGVGLSLGGTDKLDRNYLRQLKELADRIQPQWISDHLCWTGAHGVNLHDLMPLPYTEEAINHVASRIQQVQDYLGRRILIENVSSYVTYHDSVMSEWDFINAIVVKADCLMLFDINNIYVSSINHHFNAVDYINAIPTERVQQFHLAGHRNCGTHIVDTHDEAVIDEVWHLYEYAIKRFGAISTMIERDDNIPELPELIAELNQARAITTSIEYA